MSDYKKIPKPTSTDTVETYLVPYIREFQAARRDAELLQQKRRNGQSYTESEFKAVSQRLRTATHEKSVRAIYWKDEVKRRQAEASSSTNKNATSSAKKSTTAKKATNPSKQTSDGKKSSNRIGTSSSGEDYLTPGADISKPRDEHGVIYHNAPATSRTTGEAEKKKTKKTNKVKETVDKYSNLNRDEWWDITQPIVKKQGSSWIESHIGKVEHPKITDDMKDKLDQEINNDWNNKVKDSRADLMENLKKQGWDVPSDEAGQQALYEQVQQMSPDLFYQGMYVGTDPNSIKNAKRAFQLCYDSGQRVEANRKKRAEATKLTEEQKKKQQTEKLGDTLSDLAQQAIDAKLQSMMSDNVKAVLAKYGYDWTAQGCIDAVKDTIRAFHYARYMSQDQLDKLKAETYDTLSAIIDDQTDKIIDRYSDIMMKTKINPLINEVGYKAKEALDNAEKKFDDFERKYQIKLAMIDNLGTTLQGKAVAEDKKIEAKLAKFGIHVNLESKTNAAAKKIGDQVAASLKGSKFGQNYTNTQAQITTVSQAVQRYKKMIDQYQQSARKLVQKWISVVKDKVKKETARLLKRLLATVHVSCGSIQLKF